MSNILHQIKVYTYPNHLTDNPNDHSARVISERSLGVAEICETAVNRAKAPTTVQAMEHNVKLFLEEMAYQLMDGYAVNTGYFTANVQVRGVFDSPTENFDPKKHSILFRFNQGVLLRKEIPNVSVQVMGAGDSNIVISHVVDRKTGSVNDLITPNGVLKIRGGRLKIVGDHQDVGVYFEDEDGSSAARVDEIDIIVNNPSELMVIVPDLPQGSYRLVVKNQYTVGKILKEPRTAVFEKILTVE